MSGFRFPVETRDYFRLQNFRTVSVSQTASYWMRTVSVSQTASYWMRTGSVSQTASYWMRTGSVSQTASYWMRTGCQYLWVRRPDCGVDRLPPSKGEDEWNYTFSAPVCFSLLCCTALHWWTDMSVYTVIPTHASTWNVLIMWYSLLTCCNAVAVIIRVIYKITRSHIGNQ